MAIPKPNIFGNGEIARIRNRGFSLKPVRSPYDGEMRPHHGADYTAPLGTPLKSWAGGKVIDVGWGPLNGNFIRIDHGGGYVTTQIHLKEKPNFKKGDLIQNGQVIGKVGSTGASTGPHLHLQLKHNGKLIDPESIYDLEEHIRPSKSQQRQQVTPQQLILPEPKNTQQVTQNTATQNNTTMAGPRPNRQSRITGLETAGISASDLLFQRFGKDITEVDEGDIEQLGKEVGFSRRDTRRAIKGLRKFQQLENADIKLNQYGSRFNTVFSEREGEGTPAVRSARRTGMRDKMSPAALLGVGRNVNYLAGMVGRLINQQPSETTTSTATTSTFEPNIKKEPTLVIPELPTSKTDRTYEEPQPIVNTPKVIDPASDEYVDKVLNGKYPGQENTIKLSDKIKLSDNDFFREKAVLPAIGSGFGGVQYRSLSDPNFSKGPLMTFSEDHYNEMIRLKQENPDASNDDIVRAAFENLSNERKADIAINVALAAASPLVSRAVQLSRPLVTSTTRAIANRFGRYVPQRVKDLFKASPKMPGANLSRQEAIDQAAARMAEESGEMGTRLLRTPNIPLANQMPNININRNALSKLSQAAKKKFDDAISWKNNSWQWRQGLSPERQREVIDMMKKYGVMRQGGTLPKYQSDEFGTNRLPGRFEMQPGQLKFNQRNRTEIPNALSYLTPNRFAQMDMPQLDYGLPKGPRGMFKSQSSEMVKIPTGQLKLNQRTGPIEDYTPVGGWDMPAEDTSQMFDISGYTNEKEKPRFGARLRAGLKNLLFNRPAMGGGEDKSGMLGSALETLAVTAGPALLASRNKMKGVTVPEYKPVQMRAGVVQDLPRDYQPLLNRQEMGSSDFNENMRASQNIDKYNKDAEIKYNLTNAMQKIQSKQAINELLNRGEMFNAQMGQQGRMGQAQLDMQRNYYNQQNMADAMQAGFGNLADRWKYSQYANQAGLNQTYADLITNQNTPDAVRQSAIQRLKLGRAGGKLTAKNLLKRKK